MATRITDKLVKALEAPAKGNVITWDTELPGFGVRITSGGVRAFILNYRVGGREKRKTIGRYPTWSVAAARAEAKALKQGVDKGHDPLADRGAPTVAQLAERYQREVLVRNRPSTRRAVELMLDKVILPKLGKLKVSAIKLADIDALHQSLHDRPYRANRVVGWLRRMFNLAIRWQWIERNPCVGIELYPEEPRHRYLSPAELERLNVALAESDNQCVANVIRLLLLTGCRSSEARLAAWDQFDLNAGSWSKPSSHTKQKKYHRIPLSQAAVQLIDSQPRISEYVFAKPDGSPTGKLFYPWKRIREAAVLDDVHVHDLRHTAASIMASSGLSLRVIGALLGHSKANTTQRYAHLADDPLREAAETVARAVNGEKKAKVLPIRGKKAAGDDE